MDEQISAALNSESSADASRRIPCFVDPASQSMEQVSKLLPSNAGVNFVVYSQELFQSCRFPRRLLLLIDGSRPALHSLVRNAIARFGRDRLGLCGLDWTFDSVLECMHSGAKHIFILPSDLTRLMSFVAAPTGDGQSFRRVDSPHGISDMRFQDPIRTLGRRLDQGYSAKQIANELQISVRTVHLRKQELFRKFNCSSKKELLATPSFREYLQSPIHSAL